MDYLAELDATILQQELLVFLDEEDVEINSLEEFEKKFIEFIKEDLCY